MPNPQEGAEYAATARGSSGAIVAGNPPSTRRIMRFAEAIIS